MVLVRVERKGVNFGEISSAPQGVGERGGGAMQKRSSRTVPLVMLRRFLGATICSIAITSLFFVHVHVSPSPTHDDHKFNDKIPTVCELSPSSLSLCFLCTNKKKSVFLGFSLIVAAPLVLGNSVIFSNCICLCTRFCFLTFFFWV